MKAFRNSHYLPLLVLVGGLCYHISVDPPKSTDKSSPLPITANVPPSTTIPDAPQSPTSDADKSTYTRISTLEEVESCMSAANQYRIAMRSPHFLIYSSTLSDGTQNRMAALFKGDSTGTVQEFLFFAPILDDVATSITSRFIAELAEYSDTVQNLGILLTDQTISAYGFSISKSIPANLGGWTLLSGFKVSPRGTCYVTCPSDIKALMYYAGYTANSQSQTKNSELLSVTDHQGASFNLRIDLRGDKVTRLCIAKVDASSDEQLMAIVAQIGSALTQRFTKDFEDSTIDGYSFRRLADRVDIAYPGYTNPAMQIAADNSLPSLPVAPQVTTPISPPAENPATDARPARSVRAVHRTELTSGELIGVLGFRAAFKMADGRTYWLSVGESQGHIKVLSIASQMVLVDEDGDIVSCRVPTEEGSSASIPGF